MVQIASVDIGTKLDLSGFYQGLGSLSSIKTPTIKLGVKFDDLQLAQEKRRLENILKHDYYVKIKVDDTEVSVLDKKLQNLQKNITLRAKNDTTPNIIGQSKQGTNLKENFDEIKGLLELIERNTFYTATGEEIADTIITAFAKVITGLSVLIGQQITIALAPLATIVAKAAMPGASAKPNLLGNLASGFAMGAGNMLGQKAVQSFFDKRAAKSAGAAVAEGIEQGAVEKQNKIKTVGIFLAESVVNSFKKRLGIKSPSKVFADLGAFVVKGFEQGLAEFKKINVNKFTDPLVAKFSVEFPKLAAAARTPVSVAKGYSLKQMQSLQQLSERLRSNQSIVPESFKKVFDVIVPEPLKIKFGLAQNQNYISSELNKITSDLKGNVLKALKFFNKPIDIFLAIRVKGASEMYKQLQKFIDENLGKAQEKSASLPFFGDAASKGIGGLRLLNTTMLGATIAGLGFASMLRKIGAMNLLAARVALVTDQFAALRKQFTYSVGEGTRSAEMFDALRVSLSKTSLDLLTAIEGSRNIIANLRGTFDTSFSKTFAETAGKTARVYSVDPVQQKQVFAAFDTLTQGSVVTTSSIDRLGNVAPGTFDLMAQAMGMTNLEFEKAIASGTVLVEDLLPKLKAQLDISNEPKLAGAQDTIDAATTRYNNANTNLQISIGKALIPIETFRLNTLAKSLELVNEKGEFFGKWVTGVAFVGIGKYIGYVKNLVVALAPLALRIPVIATAVGIATTAFAGFSVILWKLLPIFKKIALEVLYMQLAFDLAFTAIPKALKDAGGNFTVWADTATASVKRYKDALDEARKGTKSLVDSLPKNSKDVKGESVLEDTLIGTVIGKENTRKLERGMQDNLINLLPGGGLAKRFLPKSVTDKVRLRTYAEKQMDDSIAATYRLTETGGGIIDDINKFRTVKGGTTGELKEYNELQKKIEAVRIKRRGAINRGGDNVELLASLRDEEKTLLRRSEIVSKPVLGMQSALIAQIQLYKDALAEYDVKAEKGEITQEKYLEITNVLKVSLNQAEKAQIDFNKQIQAGTDGLSTLQSRSKEIQTTLTDSRVGINNDLIKSQTAFTESLSLGELTTGEENFKRLELQLTSVGDNLTLTKEKVVELREAIAIADGEEILKNWNIDYTKTGAEGFENLAQKASERKLPKEQEVFTQYKRLKELETESLQIESSVADKKKELTETLTNLSQEITDFYESASRQFAETSLEANRQTSELKIQTYATDIRNSISGFQDNIVSQFADSVIDSIQQLSEAADKQFDVESAVLQANNALEDSLKQGNELSKKLPGITTKGVIDIPAIPIELDLSKLGIDNSFLDITEAFTKNLSEANNTIKDSESATDSLTSAFQDVTLSSVDFSDSIKNAVTNTDEGTFAVQDLGTELLNTTFTVSDLGFAIDTNTDSLNANNDAVIATNDSLFGSIEATGIVTASTVNWGTETGNVHNVIEDGLKVALNSLPVCLQDIIKNTVDWFSTFANNIPILNSIGQIFNSWGQQLGSVSQSVASFGQGAIQNIGNVVQQGVGFVQNALGMGGDKPPVGNASQPVFPIAGVTFEQAQSKKTSPWGMRRHPVTGQMKMHRGQDYGFGTGTQVVSPMAGVVTGVRYQEGGAGKYVVVESLDEQGRKIEHKFFHLSAYDVKEGQKVNAGDKIGKVGSTGIGTGAHLHYETWINGKNVNPSEFLAGRNGRGLSAAQKGMIEQHHPGDGHDHGEKGLFAGIGQGVTAVSVINNSGQPEGAQIRDYSKLQMNQGAAQGYYQGFSQTIVDLIKNAEGFHTTAYRDTDGVATIGYGTRIRRDGRKVQFGDTIGKDEADWALAQEMNKAKQEVLARVKVPLTENQLSALVSFAFNGGGGMLDGTTLLKKLNSGDYSGAAEQFQRFNKAQGGGGLVELPGLTKRRLAEARLFMTPSGQATPNQPAQTGQTAVSIPQVPQIANTPIPTVWTPGSVNTRGNAVINEVTGRAEQQRDRQIELARQKASNEAAQNTATALRNSNKAFLELERGLRENGIKVNSLGNQVTDTNLEYQGALDNEQKRLQEQRKLEEKYSELENNLVEQSRTIKSQVDTAKTLLSKGGIVSPEMRERVQKLIDDPNIKDNLKEQLRTALTTGVLGDDGRNILTRAVSEGEDQLKKLETGLSSVRSGRVESKKLLDERFAREEAVRKQQAGFDIESASLETLKAKLEQLQTLKEKTPFAPEVQGIPALEQVIKSREEQLNLEKQLKEIADKERDKTYTKEEADKLRTEVQARKKIVDATIAQKTEQAKIILQREQENRNREAANELAQSELASDKAKVEQLKLLAQTNPLAPELQNNAIGDLEQRIALREAELQLAQDLAAIEQQAIEGKRTPDEVSKLKAGKQDEYQKKIENIKTQGEQTAFANQISQEKTILSIKQQQLDYQKQVSDITTQAINLGLQQGDPLKLKFEIDKSELAVNVEKQILDMKEFARSTGKSQDEVATLEQQIRGLNAVSLGNLEAEFNKAITARATAIGQKVTESRVELLDSKASFYSNRGMTNEARGLQRESAILQQQNSYKTQKNDLEEFIKTNQVGAAEAANLRDNLEQVNQVKFDSIKDNFNAFKPVIDNVQSGLKNFFAGIIKGGQSIGDLFKGLMDSVLSSVAELASNFLVEKLFGGILGKGKNEGQGGMFAKGDSGGSSPLSPISNILGDGSDVGTSALTPMFVNVVNGDTLGGLGKGNGLTSIFGGKEDSSNNLTPSLFSGFTGKVDSANPVPVGIIKSAPDALSPITNVLGNVFGGKGGLGSIVGGIGSLFSGGTGKGGNGLGSILGSVGGMFGGGGGLGGIIGIASSLLGGFFWEGGIVGNYAHGGLAEAIGRERDMNGGRAVAIAALTHGERVLNLSQTANLEKLGGIDILNFSDGGTVGYVPTKTEYGGSADKVTESKSQPRDVNVKLETQVINGVEYLTKSQGEELARKAAEQGAMQGARYVSDKLINSPSYRSTHGL